ncbi:hypothetical protein ACH5RR_037405 [Cinchona calisaya]|uniref:Uncharacterized protein n=1 Tax=Cinchona calisaya TaxID=153742 RepID=A0ABD2Y617_9GENT
MELVEEDIRIGRVEEVAVALRELKTALRMDNDEATAAQDEQNLQEALMRFMESAVRYEQGTSSFHVNYWLSIALYSFEGHGFGILDYALARVADLIIKHVISCAISCRSTISIEEKISEDRGPDSEVVLAILSSIGDMNDSLDGGTMYSALVQIVEFINKALCFQ